VRYVLSFDALRTSSDSWRRAGALLTASLALGAAIRGQTLLPEHPIEASLWYAGAAAAFVASLWPWATSPVAPAGIPGADTPLGRLWSLAVAVVLAGVGLALFSRRTAPALVVALWAASIITAVVVAWRLDRRQPARDGSLPWLPADSLLMLGVVALAAFFRLWQLDHLPGIFEDEAPHVEFAYKVLDGEISTPFQEGFWSNSAMIHYVTASLMLLGFDDIWALKLTGALPGILTVVFLYLLLRELLNRPAAALGAGMLAVSSWQLVNSRFGYAVAIDGLSVAAALYFLLRGLRRARHLDFAIAGLWLGLGLIMTRVAVVAPVLAAILVALFGWQRGWRRAWDFRVHALLLVLVMALFFAPRALYIFQEGPTNVLSRHEEVFLFSKSEWASLKENPVQAVAENAKDYFLLFNYRSGGHARWNARPFRPALDVAAAALVVLGLGYALSRPRSWLTAVLLSTLVVMLIPGSLSLALEDQPMQYRAIGVIPAVFGLAAVPLWLFWEATPKPWGRAAVGLAALGLLAFSAFDNYDAYFNAYGKNPLVYYNTGRPETWAAKEVLRLNGDYEVYLTSTQLFTPTVDRLVKEHGTYNVLDGTDDLPVAPPADNRNLAFVVMIGPNNWSLGELGPQIFDRLRALYPGGRTLREERDPVGKLVGLSYAVSHAEAQSRFGP